MQVSMAAPFYFSSRLVPSDTELASKDDNVPVLG